MSTQANNVGAPAATGVEALASAAFATLRRTQDRALPLWFAIAVFYALNHAPAPSQGGDAYVVQEVINHEAWLLTNLLVNALASAIGLRIFLGRGREALKPDTAMGAYIGIVTLLGIAPAVMLTDLHAPALSTLVAGFPNSTIRLVLGVAAGVAILWASLRLTLWPIARLLGDRRVTGEQSWILMRGAVISFTGALLLLTAPLLMLNYALMELTQHASSLVRDAVNAPLEGGNLLSRSRPWRRRTLPQAPEALAPSLAEALGGLGAGFSLHALDGPAIDLLARRRHHVVGEFQIEHLQPLDLVAQARGLLEFQVRRTPRACGLPGRAASALKLSPRPRALSHPARRPRAR